jgi:hypothetical protein
MAIVVVVVVIAGEDDSYVCNMRGKRQRQRSGGGGGGVGVTSVARLAIVSACSRAWVCAAESLSSVALS